MRASVNLLPDSIVERGTSPPSSQSHGQLQKHRAVRVNQPVIFPVIALTIACPGSGQHEAGTGGRQATSGEKTDRRGYEKTIDRGSIERISIPDAVASTGECLLILGPAESRKSPSESAMLQCSDERHSIPEDLDSTQSPLVSLTLSGNEEPPSPSTTLVDDESISSAFTSVDPCLLTNRSFGSTESVESNFFGTETNFYTSQATLHAQASSETILPRKRHTLRKREPPFTDSTEYYYNTFAIKLQALNSKNSENTLRIESYLAHSEAEWLDCIRGLNLGKPRASTPSSLAFSQSIYHRNTPGQTESSDIEHMNQFSLQTGHRTLTGLRNALLIQIGDWPVYSLLIALVRIKRIDEEFLANAHSKGQILAVSSYHITLLTGEIGQSDTEFYVMSSIYIATSLFWWLSFRTFKSVYILATPFTFYGLAFFFLALAPLLRSAQSTRWMQHIATAHYAAASSSGGFYFALNFANERMSPPSRKLGGYPSD